MTEARRATRSEELLFERERQGVRTLTIVRGLFVLVMVTTDWIVGVNLFEKISHTVIGALVLVAIGRLFFCWPVARLWGQQGWQGA